MFKGAIILFVGLGLGFFLGTVYGWDLDEINTKTGEFA